ncbi:hypothetical protein P3X46_034520, partial [Hevea brasiliensis]
LICGIGLGIGMLPFVINSELYESSVFIGLYLKLCCPNWTLSPIRGVDCNTLGKSHIDKTRERCWVN